MREICGLGEVELADPGRDHGSLDRLRTLHDEGTALNAVPSVVQCTHGRDAR